MFSGLATLISKALFYSLLLTCGKAVPSKVVYTHGGTTFKWESSSTATNWHVLYSTYGLFDVINASLLLHNVSPSAQIPKQIELVVPDIKLSLFWSLRTYRNTMSHFIYYRLFWLEIVWVQFWHLTSSVPYIVKPPSMLAMVITLTTRSMPVIQISMNQWTQG